uniref:ATP synthase complex subunit 8 n=1 Tax=Microchironomus tabarui TaxID=1483702 RepID=A0A8F6U4V8_9DIPT|nr:ATP synthase F0 subunit 8 [Microchironomus tabarui]
MPQMSPMSWTILFFMFTLLFLFFNILNYFNFIPSYNKTSKETKMTFNNNFLTWKW